MLFWGISDFLSAILGRKLDSITSSFLYYSMSAAMFFIAFVYFNGFNFSQLTVGTLGIAVIDAVVYVFGTVAFFKAMDLGKVNVVSSIVPFYSSIPFLAGIFFLHESLKINQIAGAILALFSASMMHFNAEDMGSAKKKQILMSLVVVFSWGLFITIVNYFVPGTDMLLFYSIVFAFGSAILGLYKLASGWNLKSRNLKISKKSLLLSFLISLTAVLAFVSYGHALNHTYSSVVSVISTMSQTVTVLLASVFLKEKTTPREWLFLLLVLAGIGFLSA